MQAVPGLSQDPRLLPACTSDHKGLLGEQGTSATGPETARHAESWTHLRLLGEQDTSVTDPETAHHAESWTHRGLSGEQGTSATGPETVHHAESWTHLWARVQCPSDADTVYRTAKHGQQGSTQIQVFAPDGMAQVQLLRCFDAQGYQQLTSDSFPGQYASHNLIHRRCRSRLQKWEAQMLCVHPARTNFLLMSALKLICNHAACTLPSTSFIHHPPVKCNMNGAMMKGKVWSGKRR